MTNADVLGRLLDKIDELQKELKDISKAQEQKKIKD